MSNEGSKFDERKSNTFTTLNWRELRQNSLNIQNTMLPLFYDGADELTAEGTHRTQKT